MGAVADWAIFAGALLGVLAAIMVPGAITLRILGARSLWALAAAPALAAAIAGVAAILAGLLGISWGPVPYVLACALAAGAAAVLRRLGVRLPQGREDARHGSLRSVIAGIPLPWLWLLGAACIQVGPILHAFGRADGVLQRWDTLFHLSALRRVLDTGDGSTLTLGALTNSARTPVFYPAAFHDLATVIPGVTPPILLNAATVAVAVVPWALGCAALARAWWPEIRWGGFAAAILAMLIPAAPVDEWIHLSPIPNLMGMAFLPGALALATVMLRAMTEKQTTVAGCVLAIAVMLTAVLGLGLGQPNAAVMMLLLVAIVAIGLGWRRWRERPWLLAVPLGALAPVAALQWTPLGARVTSFVGGLQVPLSTGIGEVASGLLTVWPMAIGPVIAVLWWPGLARTAIRGPRFVVAAWALVVVLYLDAAVDSSWNLSVLFYRGQDRLAMPLAMLSVMLAVPGLVFWSRIIRTRTPAVITGGVILACVVALSSIPARAQRAADNATLDEPGRSRFLQEDELEAFAAHADEMRDGVILASPFSGAAHMYGIHGLSVRFPVAGMGTSPSDTAVLTAVSTAGTDPAACRTLEDAGIAYVYLEQMPYQYSRGYEVINGAEPELGPSVFTTSHSEMIRVDCDDGR